MRFEFTFEPFEQSQSICNPACKADDRPPFADASHLVGTLLHDRLAKGHLSIRRQSDLAIANHRDDGRRARSHSVTHRLHRSLLVHHPVAIHSFIGSLIHRLDRSYRA